MFKRNRILENRPFCHILSHLTRDAPNMHLLFLPELLKIFPYYSLKYHQLFPNYSAHSKKIIAIAN